jgi:hypothetical protein
MGSGILSTSVQSAFAFSLKVAPSGFLDCCLHPHSFICR